jgi:hypothetical protein
MLRVDDDGRRIKERLSHLDWEDFCLMNTAPGYSLYTIALMLNVKTYFKLVRT